VREVRLAGGGAPAWLLACTRAILAWAMMAYPYHSSPPHVDAASPPTSQPPPVFVSLGSGEQWAHDGNLAWRARPGPSAHHHHHHHDDHDHHSKEEEEDATLWLALGRGLLRAEESRRAVVFLALLASFTVVQFLHAYLWTHSLALLAQSFHTGFGAVSMGLAVVASACSRLPARGSSYSYGYQRFEVVAGFVSGASTCFACLFIFFEAAEHFLISVSEAAHHGFTAWEVALVGLGSACLNLVCHLYFQPLRRLTCLESSGDANDRPWIVQGTVVTTIATLSVPFLLGWGIAVGDMLVAVVSAIFLLTVATPFTRHTGKVLLQTTPNIIKDRIGKSLSEASTYEGVLECRKEHFWALAPHEYVGTFYLRVKQDTDEQLVLAKVTNLFSTFVKHLTVQIEKEESYFQ